MGRPKPLLPWRGATLIAFQVQELAAAGCAPVVVVLGHAAEEVRPHVPPDATVVVNEGYRQGRASSLRAGAAALPDDAELIVVLSVDQPRPRAIIDRLVAAQRAARGSITVPVYQGRRGHPVVLPGSLLLELRAATEEQRGLRGILDAHAPQVVEVSTGDATVVLDLNTPDDYDRALAKFAGHGIDP